MSILKGFIKAGIVTKVIQIAKREMGKPENQRKAKEALKKFQQRSR